ncbi:MAG: CpsD/CapB family tyrosine-protein kinase [Oscillospiraceae bacterium]|nr:CpsD/CapB family tyrosine-protein kinase [Oscillospiraceae bacterium]
MENINIKATEATSTYIMELYRILRTNVEFSGADNKVIAITSSTPGDGKSTVSFRLAQVFAEADNSVLLLDADMRKSELRSKMESKKDYTGLSHILVGKAKLSEVVYSTNVKNLFLLPTGVFPTNPAELLSTSIFDELISTIRGKFDYIIIDTPPIGSVIDAALVANKADGSIIVISSDKNPRTIEKKAIEQMNKANPNIIGVVLKDVNTGFDSRYQTYKSKYSYYTDNGADSKKKSKKSRWKNKTIMSIIDRRNSRRSK